MGEREGVPVRGREAVVRVGGRAGEKEDKGVVEGRERRGRSRTRRMTGWGVPCCSAGGFPVGRGMAMAVGKPRKHFVTCRGMENGSVTMTMTMNGLLRRRWPPFAFIFPAPL